MGRVSRFGRKPLPGVPACPPARRATQPVWLELRVRNEPAHLIGWDSIAARTELAAHLELFAASRDLVQLVSPEQHHRLPHAIAIASAKERGLRAMALSCAHALEEPIDEVIRPDARAHELRGTPDRVHGPLKARERLVVRARERLDEKPARSLNLPVRVDVHTECHRRWLLLALTEVVREVLRDFARDERNDTRVRLPPRGVVAHHGEHTAAERRRDVELAVARRGMRRRIAGEATDVTRGIRDHGERAKRTIPAKLQLRGLLVFCSGRDQHRTHEAAAEGGGGGRGRAVALRSLSYELGGDERADENAAVERDGSDELVRSQELEGREGRSGHAPREYRGERHASIATGALRPGTLALCAS